MNDKPKTLRDEFAMRVLPALMANASLQNLPLDVLESETALATHMSALAYLWADAMMQERAK